MKSENPALRNKTDRIPLSHAHDEFPVGDFYEHWSLSEIASQNAEGDYRSVLRWCVDLLEQSPTARRFLAEAKNAGWRAGLSDLPGQDFYLDVPQKLLLLDSRGLEPGTFVATQFFRNSALISMIRALRDIWQEKRHGGFDEDYGPEAVLMLERARAADGEAIAALTAWELRAAGYPEIWRHLIGTPEGDIATAFSNHLERHPMLTSAHPALEAAFRQWYRDELRVNTCDHGTLEYLDDVLRDRGAGNPFGMAPLTAGSIEVLSCLPDRTAYLQNQGGSILRDPAYYGLSDPINQSHLFHIMYDLQAVRVGGVAFRDPALARRIFPPKSKDSKAPVT